MQVESSDYNPYIPTHYMVVYTKKVDFSNKHYLETGSFNLINGKYVPGELAPADQNLLNDLANSIKVENFKALKFKGLTPKNVIYHHSDSEHPTIAWVQLAGKRQLYFSDEISKSGLYQMPMHLFFCKHGHLYCYIIEDTESLDDKIYMMPLPNIQHDGEVCLGNGKRKLKKATCLEEYISNMEKIFYLTNFNALHHTYFDGIYALEIKKMDLTKFPLIQHSKIKTLKDLLK